MPQTLSQPYVESIRAWQGERHAELSRPDGWLTLAGLFWLESGENAFGGDPAQAVAFPGDAPAHMGHFTLDGDGVSVTVAPGVDVRWEGQPVTSMRLVADYDDGPTTVLTWGSLSWFVIKRGDRYGVRLRDSQHPALAAFTGVECFPIDPAWRVEAVLDPYDPPQTVQVPTMLGTVMEQASPGALVFAVDGETYRLDALGDSRDEVLNLIFADATTGKETYGGGRFLSVDAPDGDGRTVIDFNRAFNPPCVFTPYATCPRPPQQNRLALPIPAGEKVYVVA
jgi:uncharacterized protein (DUF1684 family)